MTSAIPTESLLSLYGDLDFLAKSVIGQKPCFKGKYYVSADTWAGYIWRKIDGENQSITGNSRIISICRNASETYTSKKDDPYVGDMLLTKICEARKGLERIKNTYENLNNISNATNIGSGILILDLVIPNERKIAEGFMHAPIKKQEVTDVPVKKQEVIEPVEDHQVETKAPIEQKHKGKRGTQSDDKSGL